MGKLVRVVMAVVCGLVENGWAKAPDARVPSGGKAAGGGEVPPGSGPRLISQKEFDITRLYAPVIEGNPPPRVEDKKVKYDSFLPAPELQKRIDACGGTAILAFKNSHLNRGWYLGKPYITDEEFEKARESVFSEVSDVYDVTPEYVPGGQIVGADKVVRPQRIVRITNYEAIDELRKHKLVDYVEPSCPNDLQWFSFAGCWGTTTDGLLTLPADESSSDSREKSIQQNSGEWVPWSFTELGVVDAWNYLEAKSQLPGAGVTVGIVDTGLSSLEPELTTGFSAAKGLSPILDFAPPFTDSFDTCDHGTRMASFAVAPENGTLMVGVAKHSFLFASRIGDGVVHATLGRAQIGLSIERAAGASQVVTLAWGMPFGSQTISDSITKSLVDTQVVFLAAAGTLVPFGASFFPATLENETVSVTAIAPRRGSPTDFERLPTGPIWEVAYNEGVDILGIADVNNASGPAIGLNVGLFSTFGGSSAATAQLAGVFALSAASFRVRTGRLPTREELTNRVLSFAYQGEKLSSETFVAGRSPAVGLGLVNVYAAVGGLMSVSIAGNRTQLGGQPFTLAVEPVGDGPFSFEWRADGDPTVISTSPAPTFVIPMGTLSRTFSATAIELQTNHRKRAEITISTVPTHTRMLFARDLVSSYSSFLDGHRIDRTINPDFATQPGCNVRAVLGQEYLKNSAGMVVPFGSPVAAADMGNRGFSVTRPTTWFSNQMSMPPEGLGAYVHAWHDGLSSVRVRPVYVFDEPDGMDCMTGVLQETP